MFEGFNKMDPTLRSEIESTRCRQVSGGGQSGEGRSVGNTCQILRESDSGQTEAQNCTRMLYVVPNSPEGSD